MKQVAFILSFYILSLGIMPMVKAVVSQYSECHKSCFEDTEGKDTDGCPKQMCSPFSCCLKTFVLFQNNYMYTLQPVAEPGVKNNFAFRQMLFSLKDFDIWNPPRFI